MLKRFLCTLLGLTGILLPLEAQSLADSLNWKGLDTLTLDSIPKELSIKGELLESYRWKDSMGRHLLVFSRKGPLRERSAIPGEPSGDWRVDIFAEQYVQRDTLGPYELLWDIRDFVRFCPFDMWAGPVPGGILVTDLDRDSITETTLVYKLTCRGDHSPSQMKLIVHEGEQKMALRGTMILEAERKVLMDSTFHPNLATHEYSEFVDFTERAIARFGRYENEEEFSEAPDIFLLFAREQWLRLVVRDDFLQLRKAGD